MKSHVLVAAVSLLARSTQLDAQHAQTKESQ